MNWLWSLSMHFEDFRRCLHMANLQELDNFLQALCRKNELFIWEHSITLEIPYNEIPCNKASLLPTRHGSL